MRVASMHTDAYQCLDFVSGKTVRLNVRRLKKLVGELYEQDTALAACDRDEWVDEIVAHRGPPDPAKVAIGDRGRWKKTPPMSRG